MRLRFCTSDIDFSYLSVDPTFNFGNFSVTPTSYRNLLLKSRKTGKTPVFIGSTFIHHTKQRTTYKQFFDKLISLRPQLHNVLSYGTDGETAVSDALEEAFPLAIHLRCFRCNLQTFLSALSTTTTHEYFDEIFGKQEGNVYQEGLLDAVTDDDFDVRLFSLRDSWARREKCSADDCKLYDWMVGRSFMMKSCMVASLRTKPGLGNPPFHLNFTPMTARTLTGACETRRKGASKEKHLSCEMLKS